MPVRRTIAREGLYLACCLAVGAVVLPLVLCSLYSSRIIPCYEELFIDVLPQWDILGWLVVAGPYLLFQLARLMISAIRALRRAT